MRKDGRRLPSHIRSIEQALGRALDFAYKQSYNQPDASITGLLAAIAVHLLEYEVEVPPPAAACTALAALLPKWQGKEVAPSMIVMAPSTSITAEQEAARQEAVSDVAKQNKEGVVRFTFVSVAYVLASEAKTLPSFQGRTAVEVEPPTRPASQASGRNV